MARHNNREFDSFDTLSAAAEDYDFMPLPSDVVAEVTDDGAGKQPATAMTVFVGALLRRYRSK
jgi:hypothetical protein